MSAVVRSLKLGVPPDWAVAWGEDGHGVFAAFAVGPREDPVEQVLRWIPAGTFTMGSPDGELGRFEDEGPQHAVTLTEGYWLGETPVTQALWLAVMGDNPSNFKGAGRRADLRRPVESVSWDACQDFIERLNRMLHDQWTARDAERGEPLVLRLPTEAEWERACRGGKEPSGATWVGELSGQDRAPELDPIAWYGGNSGSETHPVGLKDANPYGLRDMLGNVYEWCEDQGELRGYGRRYTAESATNPRSTQGPYRVSRGGSWFSDAGFVRAAIRSAYAPGFAGDDLGLRLAGGQAAPSKQ